MSYLAPIRAIAYSVILAALALAAGTAACTSSKAAPPSSSASTGFEEVLDAGELAKFRDLPAEFQDALLEESEKSPATARQYLRDLPEEVSPMAEILPPEALSKFEELSPRLRHAVLLGYDEAFKDRPGQDPAKTVAPSNILAGMVDLAHTMEFGDGKVFLPPMAETLSQETLARLDSVDDRMERAFHLIWDNRRVRPEEVEGAVRGLEEALLAAPDALPDTAGIGLSAYSMGLIEEVPPAKRFVDEWLAAEIVQDLGWRSNAVQSIDRLLVQYRTPEDRDALARLYLPLGSGIRPIACELGPRDGVWPTWALPAPFQDAPPNSLVASWPNHRETLSPEALTKLDSLDARLRETFDLYWYGTGPLPMEAGLMACLALMWDARLRHVPFTAPPPLDSFLSDEALVEYDKLSEEERDIIRSELMRAILEGEAAGPTSVVYLHTATTEESLEALGALVESLIRGITARPTDR